MKIKKIINIVIVLIFLATIAYAEKNLCENKPNPCFKELEGVNEKIEKLKGLEVGETNYKELQVQSEDVTVSIESLYEEASMYKNLALLRTQIEGLPKEVLKELEEKKVAVAKKKKSGKAKKVGAKEETKYETTSYEMQGGTKEEKISIDNKIIRSHIIKLYDATINENIGTLKYFDGNWYWGEEGEYPENPTNEARSSSTKIIEKIAFIIKYRLFKGGIEDIVEKVAESNKLAASNNKIIIESESGKKIKEFTPREQIDDMIQDIINNVYKDLKKEYSQTSESYELEVYSGEGLFAGLGNKVVYLKYEDGWMYKVKKSNEYSQKGDVINGVPMKVDLPSEWYSSELINYIYSGELAYQQGIKVIVEKLNTKGPGWFGNPSVRIITDKEKIKLPKNKEKKMSLDELGSLASKKIEEKGKIDVKTKFNEIILSSETDSSLNFMDGLKIFIPKKENYKYYPVLIYLHGTDQASKFDKFKEIIKKSGKPIILVEPTDNNKKNIWGKNFDYDKLIEIINLKLNDEAIQILNINVIGHSGAGCNPNNGIYKIIQQENALYFVGLADTCYSEKYAKKLLGVKSIISINNGATGGGWPEESRNFAEFESIIETTMSYENCDKNYYSYCNKNSNNEIFSFQTKNAKHGDIPEILLVEALNPSRNLFKLFT